MQHYGIENLHCNLTSFHGITKGGETEVFENFQKYKKNRWFPQPPALGKHPNIKK